MQKQYLPSGSDNKGNLGFWFYEEIALCLGLSLVVDNTSFLVLVLLIVLLGILKNEFSLFRSFSLSLISSLLVFFQELGVSGLLLLDVLWHNSKRWLKSRKIYLFMMIA